MADSDFAQVDSGASKTFPAMASSIKKNGYVVIKGHPCKVVDTSTSKTGKHGGAKVHLTAVDIFTGKKYEELSPSTHNMQVPEVVRTDYTLIDISDEGYVSLMTEDGSTKEDLKLPEEEVGEKIRAAFGDGKDLIVTVLSAMGIEKVISFKESNQ
ncbi:translation initiation factor eIF5A [Balamuthia mandrillaris]